MLQKKQQESKIITKGFSQNHIQGLCFSRDQQRPRDTPSHSLDSAVLEHLQPEPFLGAPEFDGTFKIKTTEDGREDQITKQQCHWKSKPFHLA